MKKNAGRFLKSLLAFVFLFLFSFSFSKPESRVIASPLFARENKKGIIETLQFRETDIRTVIRSIAAQAYRDGRKVNIVTGPEITGLVTIELEGVSWQDALRIVLRAHNYGYEWVSDYIILVDTLDEIAKRREQDALSRDIEAVTSEAFRFNFAKVEDLQPVARDLITGRGKVTIDRRTNTMIISDTASNLESIRDDLRALDSITQQVLIEAKIIETTFDPFDEDTLGVDWTMNFTARSEGGPFGWSSISDAFTLGTLDTTNVSATLDLILSDSKAEILSQPTIMTMDNSPANIRVVIEDPVPRYTYSTESNMWEIAGFEYLEYGIILEVTPQINDAGFITLKIEPEVSSFVREKKFAAGGQSVDIPIIETKTTSTTVMVKDNETVVIGGLVSESDSETIRKLPILGDIPVLGWLFKSKEKTQSKKNLMIFITPRIMTPELETAAFDSFEESKEE